MEMDGIQGACSDFIILKCSGHRLTLFAWCSAAFLLFLLLGDGDMMLSDKFMGQQCPHRTLSTRLFRPIWTDAPSQSHAPTESNQTHSFNATPNSQAALVREKRGAGRGTGWLLLSVWGWRAPINLPVVCFPSLDGFHPLYSDTDGLLLAMFAALLPAPRGTLAGGGSPRMSDDVGLLQVVAEGSHNEILQAPSMKNTDI